MATRDGSHDYELDLSQTDGEDPDLVNTYHAWYKEHCNQMTAEERDECQFNVTRLTPSPSARQRPSSHRLFKATVTNRRKDWTWCTFYAMRMVYVDKQPSTIRSGDQAFSGVAQSFAGCKMTKVIAMQYPGIDLWTTSYPGPSAPWSDRWGSETNWSDGSSNLNGTNMESAEESTEAATSPGSEHLDNTGNVPEGQNEIVSRVQASPDRNTVNLESISARLENMHKKLASNSQLIYYYF